MIRTEAIRRFKMFCIATSCLSMNAATKQRNCLICRFTNATKRIPIVEGFIYWLDAQYPEKGKRMNWAVTYIRNRKDTLILILKTSDATRHAPHHLYCYYKNYKSVGVRKIFHYLSMPCVKRKEYRKI